MRSQVKMIKAERHQKGDYAVSMNFLDETEWCPTTECTEDDSVCPVPTRGQTECVGDFCTRQLLCSNFSGQNLTKARFSGSELSCANFSNANLANADFSQADLCQTTFINADLRETVFEGADLSFADFRFSDLRGADLKNVRFADVDLRGARFDRHTQLPIARDEAENRGMIYCF